MNVCSKCGKKLRKNDKVCPNCGKKVKMVKDASKIVKEAKVVAKDTKKEVKKVIEKVSDMNPNKKNSKTVNVLFWILGFVLPPVGLVLYLLWRKSKKDSAKNVGTGALVSACIWAFLGLSLLIDTKGADKKEEISYQIYNADINEWIEDFNGTGVNGWKFTSKIDASKYIFIPAAGSCNGGSVNYVCGIGYVWSSSFSTSYPDNAWYLYFLSDGCGMYNYYRYYGKSVRGVMN